MVHAMNLDEVDDRFHSEVRTFRWTSSQSQLSQLGCFKKSADDFIWTVLLSKLEIHWVRLRVQTGDRSICLSYHLAKVQLTLSGRLSDLTNSLI